MTAIPPSAPRHRVLTIPNVLTLLRILLIPFFLLASVERQFVTAFGLFVAAALTDVIDGFVARRLNQRSRLGAVLDPAADKVMMMTGYLFFTFGHLVPFRLPAWLTYMIFTRDVLIVIGVYILYSRMGVVRFPPSTAGKISTLFQAVTLAGVVGVNSVTPGLAPAGPAMFRIAWAMTLISGIVYVRRFYVLFMQGRDDAVMAPSD